MNVYFLVWPPVVLQQMLLLCVFQPMLGLLHLFPAHLRGPGSSWGHGWEGCFLPASFHHLLCFLTYQFPKVIDVRLLYVLSKMPRAMWWWFLGQLLVRSWVLGSSKRKMLSMQLPKNLCLADAWKLLAEAFRGVAYGY